MKKLLVRTNKSKEEIVKTIEMFGNNLKIEGTISKTRGRTVQYHLYATDNESKEELLGLVIENYLLSTISENKYFFDMADLDGSAGPDGVIRCKTSENLDEIKVAKLSDVGLNGDADIFAISIENSLINSSNDETFSLFKTSRDEEFDTVGTYSIVLSPQSMIFPDWKKLSKAVMAKKSGKRLVSVAERLTLRGRQSKDIGLYLLYEDDGIDAKREIDIADENGITQKVSMAELELGALNKNKISSNEDIPDEIKELMLIDENDFSVYGNVEFHNNRLDKTKGGSTVELKFKYLKQTAKQKVEAMPDSIKNVVDLGLLSNDDAIILYDKFISYEIPDKMIDAIMSQWKDYGEELNQKIPSIEEAIFIDDKKERYVRRCCGHILGNNNKFPRLRLVGHLSVGKDVLIRSLAALFHKPIDIITIFQDTQKEDIFGAKTIESEGVITYKPEPLIKAMENGTWIEFDEINVCDSGILESLHKILDSEKAVNVAGYKRVVAKEGFGFFASMNPSDSNYNGTQSLNPSTQSRMKTIEIKMFLSIKDILKSICPYASEHDINQCAIIYNSISELVKNAHISEGFLAVRLYQDALDSACWMPIKDALKDIIVNADTNDHEQCEEISTLIDTKIQG